MDKGKVDNVNGYDYHPLEPAMPVAEYIKNEHGTPYSVFILFCLFLNYD